MIDTNVLTHWAFYTPEENIINHLSVLRGFRESATQGLRHHFRAFKEPINKLLVKCPWLAIRKVRTYHLIPYLNGES